MWKFIGNGSKEKWLLVLAAGICLMILAMPSGSREKTDEEQTQTRRTVQSEAAPGREYEEEMEKRVENLLSTVEGVGKVDVMITVSSSEEKILATDSNQSRSLTEEKDSAGGTRTSRTQELQENVVLTGSSGGEQPIVEMEKMPEIRGVVVSAQGGGDVRVRAEISAALEALFHVPQHKIRVLKRVE